MNEGLPESISSPQEAHIISVSLTFLQSHCAAGKSFIQKKRSWVSTRINTTAPLMSLFLGRRQEVNGALNGVWTVCLCLRQILAPFYEQKLNQLSVISHSQQRRRRLVIALCSDVSDWQASVCRPHWGLRETDDVTSQPIELNPLCSCCRLVLPACLQITVLKEEGIILQSEAAVRLIPS